ncbi:MAG: IS66 family transposase [Kiritimatiellae bacterium]|nr:IS66 family transposase [Kiritimatiellia bacterium]
MNSDTATLPDNIPELKTIICDFAETQTRYEKTQQHLEFEIKLLKEQIAILNHRLFGRKSEKRSGNQECQPTLFDEVELTSSKDKHTEPEEEIEVPAHRRLKPGRKPLPKDLPRIDKIHDLSEEEKICACGCVKSRIGEEVSVQLDIIPQKMRVIRNIRPKYVCKNCEGVEADEPAVSIAPMPDQILPKSIATAGLISHIIVSKYADALPLYRQEKIFARFGVELKRQTMASWVIKVAQRCMPMMELIRNEIRSGPFMQIDETGVQVLKEPERKAEAKSYMWLFRGGDPDRPALLYQYWPTRAAEVPKTFLTDYKGYVQTDGYAGYEFVDDLPGVKHLGCWAHARRKFMDAIKARGKVKKKKKTGKAEVALDYITRLYAIEQSAKALNLNASQIYELRQKKAKPLIKEFGKWLEDTQLKTPPTGLLGKAVSYTIKQWDRLKVYLEDGRLLPDNNLAENAIRPFVLGRKNWMFSATPNGAHASAALYSLIETAKANELEPYWYLRYLFDMLPTAKTDEDYKALLPMYVDKTKIGQPA